LSGQSKTLDLKKGNKNFSLDGKLEYYIDKSAKMTLKTARKLSDSHFKTLKGESLSLGYTKDAVWMRLKLHNKFSQNLQLFLELVSYMDVVEIYIFKNGKLVDIRSAGRNDPIEKRDLVHRNFIYRLTFKEKGPYTLYMHFKSKGALLIPLKLWTIEGFFEKDHDEQIVFGIFFGILIIMVLYNLFVFLSIRETSYLYYVLFILFLGLIFSNIWGFTFEYLWQNVWWSNKSMVLFITICQIFALLFARSFLSTSQRHPIVNKMLLTQAAFAVLASIGAFVLPYRIAVSTGILLGVVTVVMMFAAALVSYLKRNRASRYFLLAFITLIVGILLLSFRNFGILPYNALTNYSSQIGMALMVTLLSLALADRINIMKESFARFVPNQFLSFLRKADITEVELGDSVEKEMTILFTDVRSFATISEKMTPEENFSFINDILKRVGPVIRKNNGFIDKYLGDAIMALFPGSPEDAVRAALEMNKVLEDYNLSQKNTFSQKIQMGIGIHTGSLMLGTIGEFERMEGTVISDAVNLASRLEGLTKKYGAHILISKKSLDMISKDNSFNHRFVETVQVKGKDEKVDVMEILI